MHSFIFMFSWKIFLFIAQLLHFFANFMSHVTGVCYLKHAECNISEILIKSSTMVYSGWKNKHHTSMNGNRNFQHTNFLSVNFEYNLRKFPRNSATSPQSVWENFVAVSLIKFLVAVYIFFYTTFIRFVMEFFSKNYQCNYKNCLNSKKKWCVVNGKTCWYETLIIPKLM